MSKQIITKICTKCKTEKPLNQFPFRKDGKHGRRADCRICCNARIMKRYHTPEGKRLNLLRTVRYRKTGKGKLACKRAKRKYYSTENGKRKAREQSRKYRKRFPI